MPNPLALDLADVQQVADLEREVWQGGDAAPLLEHYRQGGALGQIRAALLLHRLDPGAASLWTAELQQARRLSQSRLEELLIQAVAAWFESGAFEDDPTLMLTCTSTHLHTLLDEARRLPDASLLRLEVQWRLMLALGHRHRVRGQAEPAVHLAHEMVSLARMMPSAALLHLSQFQLASALNLSGALGDALEVHLSLARQNDTLPLVQQSSQIDAAFLLANLGQPERALELLDTVSFQTESTGSARRFVQALYGHLASPTLDAPPGDWASVGWLTRAFALLNHHHALEPTRAGDLERAQVLEQLGHGLARLPLPPTPGEAAMVRALQALGHLLRGQPGLARLSLSLLPDLPPQELLLHSLLLGLKLELYLIPGGYEVEPLERTLTAAQTLLEVGRCLSRASLPGLLGFMGRRCPQGAAFVHLVLGCPAEGTGVWRSVVNLRQGGQVYDLALPAPVVHERLLRAFGLLERTGAAPLNGRMIRHRNALQDTSGSVPYWRPLVLPHTLLYGLLKAGEPFRDAARALVQDLGLRLETDSPYGRSELRLLEADFAAWLEGGLDQAGFEQHLRVVRGR